MSTTRRDQRLNFGQRLLIWAALTISGGWEFMLAIGLIHHEWIPSCPTIGFWWSVLISFLLRTAMTNPSLAPRGRAA